MATCPLMSRPLFRISHASTICLSTGLERHFKLDTERFRVGYPRLGQGRVTLANP
jgi:hypothetical protein